MKKHFCRIFAPMKKILIIDNYDSFVYNIVQLLRESPIPVAFDIVYNDKINFNRLSEYHGLLLSPGPGVPAEAGKLLPLIRHCQHSHTILGVCLGHQAIAEAFGGKLSHLRQPLHGHASQLTFSIDGDPLLTGAEHPVVVGRYHSWTVSPDEFPNYLSIGAFDEEGHIMSIHHRSLPIHGVQFHPESHISNCGHTLINNWLKSF